MKAVRGSIAVALVAIVARLTSACGATTPSSAFTSRDASAPNDATSTANCALLASPANSSATDLQSAIDACTVPVGCFPNGIFDLIDAFSPQKTPDFYAIRTETLTPAGWSATESHAHGVACAAASDPATCENALASLRELTSCAPAAASSGSCTISYVIAINDNDVVVVSASNFVATFGQVVTWEEAVYLTGTPADLACGIPGIEYEPTEDGFILVIPQNDCSVPGVAIDAVGSDGTVSSIGTIAGSCAL